jgi:hypothetical protein
LTLKEYKMLAISGIDSQVGKRFVDFRPVDESVVAGGGFDMRRDGGRERKITLLFGDGGCSDREDVYL